MPKFRDLPEFTGEISSFFPSAEIYRNQDNSKLKIKLCGPQSIDHMRPKGLSSCNISHKLLNLWNFAHNFHVHSTLYLYQNYPCYNCNDVIALYPQNKSILSYKLFFNSNSWFLWWCWYCCYCIYASPGVGVIVILFNSFTSYVTMRVVLLYFLSHSIFRVSVKD